MLDKVLPLQEAIRRYVRPRMTLHFEIGPRAAIRAVLREFWGKDPQFTLAMVRVGGGHAGDLIHAGLVKKAIAASFVELFPRPGPMPVVRRAYEARTVEFEYWSDCSMIQRFLAGAMGVGFLPTKSLLGSSMERDNQAAGSFRVTEDPFGSEGRIGLARALNPDISFVHAVAADPAGNAIVLGSDENLWGAKASKGGVIVTTEKVATPDDIRSHLYLVSLPAYLVRAVCPVPFGAHPGSLNNYGLEEFETYAQDDEFLQAYGEATQTREALDRFLEEWVLSCPSQEAYLKKLGQERLARLQAEAKGPARRGARVDWAGVTAPPDASDYSRSEMMVVAAGRTMCEVMTRRGYDRILMGVGVGGLACEYAYLTLTRQGRLITLIQGTTGLGQEPAVHRPGHPEPSFIMLHNAVEGYAIHVGGHRGGAIAILGAGQVDRFGNINTSKISEKVFLTGSGGGNDASSQADEVLVVGRQSLRRMVEQVYYVTSSGAKVSTCVTDLGIMEKEDGSPELVLTAYYPHEGWLAEKVVEEARKQCGWKLRVSPRLAPVPPPTPEELALVRALDPERLLLGE